jgi:hexosaminidase
MTPLEPLASVDGEDGKVTVKLRQQADVGTLRYTTDGSAPTEASPAYNETLTLPEGTRLRVRAFAGGEPLGTGRDWTLTAALLRTRTATEMDLCTSAVPLRLEDDGPTDGVRRVHWGDIFHPCWIWKRAPLDGIASLSAEVGQVPFNFSIGADLAKVVFDKPRTPTGELEVRLDRCDGPVVASIPLGAATRNPGVSTITGSLPPQQGRHDLCMTFTQTGPNPLWMLDRLTLGPAK